MASKLISQTLLYSLLNELSKSVFFEIIVSYNYN